MVRQFFDLYLSHRSLIAVVKDVNARGRRKKTWQNGNGGPRGGGTFDKVYLQRLLTNPLYIGQVTLKGEVYPGQHDAIIDTGMFKRVGELLVANRNSADPLARNRHGALLKGLLRCGRCGAIMAHTWTRKKNKLYSYYTCSTAQKQGRAACATPSLSAGEIEDAVIAEIRRLPQDPALVDQVFAEAVNMAEDEQKRLESERTRLLRQRQQREAAIQRLVSTLESANGELPDVVAGRIGERETEVAQLKERLAALEQDLRTARSRDINREHLAQTLAQFTELWDVLYPRERVELVRSLIERVSYHDATNDLKIHLQSSLSASEFNTVELGASEKMG
jgi:site-specific DNA recombinase